jgi:hypothetical protein
MTRKTLKDCAVCPTVGCCDAHITGGTHKHREGVDPCQVSMQDRMLSRLEKIRAGPHTVGRVH